MERRSGPEPLTVGHDVRDFDCGKQELTEWLRRYALQNQQAGSARVFVVHRGGRVVGYYALAAASIEPALRRAVAAAEEIGARAVLVHAKDEEARVFYEKFDFESSPTDPLLFLLMKDLRSALRKQ